MADECLRDLQRDRDVDEIPKYGQQLDHAEIFWFEKARIKRQEQEDDHSCEKCRESINRTIFNKSLKHCLLLTDVTQPGHRDAESLSEKN